MLKDNGKIRKPLYKRWWFVGIVIFMVIIVGGGAEDASSDEPKKDDSPVVEDKVKVVEYEVIEKEDVSIGDIKRFQWEVVVNEPANIEQLKVVAIEVIELAKKDNDFNAIVIGFYDYPEFIGHGYTLGKVLYAPQGEWAKAETVKTGQYDKMDYTYELRKKDWTKQLSPEEVEVFNAWNELYYSKSSPADIPEESEINKEIAEQFGIQELELNHIMMKQGLWMMDDNQ